jgi:hypothetical protein
LRIADCGLRIADCGLRIADCGARLFRTRPGSSNRRDDHSQERVGLLFQPAKPIEIDVLSGLDK